MFFKVPRLAGGTLACYYSNPKDRPIPVADSNEPIGLLCHGVLSHKGNSMLSTIQKHCPLATIAIDFYTCGESSGDPETEWGLGDYDLEVEDIQSVIEYVQTRMNKTVLFLLGHSRGANVVLMHTIKYDTVPYVISLAARFQMDTGLDPWFRSPEERKQLELGLVDAVCCAKGCPDGKRRMITLKDLNKRLAINMSDLSKAARVRRVWFVHGGADSVIPVDHMHQLAAVTQNSTVCELPGLGHTFKAADSSSAGIAESLLEFLDKEVWPALSVK